MCMVFCFLSATSALLGTCTREFSNASSLMCVSVSVKTGTHLLFIYHPRTHAGTVGFFASFTFVRYIYRSIKCD